MADRVKVIKGLEALNESMHKNQCYACSHEFVETAEEFGTNIIADAIELLKSQINQELKIAQLEYTLAMAENNLKRQAIGRH